MAKTFKQSLSRLEEDVMQILWAQDTCTADAVRRKLARKQRLKDSTVRTVLRRLEQKGYVDHSVDGRTYVYRSLVPAQQAATEAVHSVVERLCRGSVEQLLVGMVSDEMLSAEQLQELARKIAEREKQEPAS